MALGWQIEKSKNLLHPKVAPNSKAPSIRRRPFHGFEKILPETAPPLAAATKRKIEVLIVAANVPELGSEPVAVLFIKLSLPEAIVRVPVMLKTPLVVLNCKIGVAVLAFTITTRYSKSRWIQKRSPSSVLLLKPGPSVTVTMLMILIFA